MWSAGSTRQRALLHFIRLPMTFLQAFCKKMGKDMRDL